MANSTTNHDKTTWKNLPAELLSNIFCHTLPIFEDMIPFDCDRLIDDNRGYYPEAAQLEDHEYMSPAIIAAVCQVWRDVAITTARLWSFVYASADISSPSSFKAVNSRL